MTSSKAAPEEFRYERKFQIIDLDIEEINLIVKLHPSLFREIYHQRFVNSIYLDSLNKQSYVDNVVGLANREKTRIRWYGSATDEIERPVLELKKKSGWVNSKETYVLESCKIMPGLIDRNIKDILTTSDIPNDLKARLTLLEPVLIVRYSRRYYLSGCNRFRITIDTELEYHPIGQNQKVLFKKPRQRSDVIAELKYNAEYDEFADSIVSKFPFRITKSSKYVSGVDAYF